LDSLDFTVVLPRLPLFIQGAFMTVQLTFFAIVFGTMIGLVVALAKIIKFPIVNFIAGIYTWVFRGIPLLVQLVLIYYGLPSLGIEFTAYQAAAIGLSLCGGAYIAEIIRAGIQSIDKGQMEAAHSLGMSWSQAMFKIIIPQAYRRLIPPMGNEFITLLKDTSLVSVISMVELLRTATIHASSSFKPFEMYITAALIYLLLTTFFTVAFGRLESKLAISE